MLGAIFWPLRFVATSPAVRSKPLNSCMPEPLLCLTAGGGLSNLLNRLSQAHVYDLMLN